MKDQSLKNAVVCEGTLITGDLIKNFSDFLREANTQAWIAFDEEFEIDKTGIAAVLAEPEEDKQCILDALIDALEDIAPEGFDFGPHPGDGSCFGFWDPNFLMDVGEEDQGLPVLCRPGKGECFIPADTGPDALVGSDVLQFLNSDTVGIICVDHGQVRLDYTEIYCMTEYTARLFLPNQTVAIIIANKVLEMDYFITPEYLKELGFSITEFDC